MRILIFNWRDIKNPTSGGAEILTHEVAKRWVKDGHSVTQFSSYYKGAKKEESVDGVKIIREGYPDARFLFWSVHFKAFVYYQKYCKGQLDLIIDEIHGLPFFTPLYVKEKKIALICEVASELWFKVYGPIFGVIGRFIEVVYLKIIYKNIIFATISNSTKQELIKNGISPNKIHVLPMGINAPIIKKEYEKEKLPTLLYIGRLSKAKGIEDAIHAVSILKKKSYNAQLKVIGRGDGKYLEILNALCKKLGVVKNVQFLGFVSEEKKFETIASSHILISPSVKEGFGLTIPEAGYMGIPSIVYNSLGLLDIVIDHKTGLVCKNNSPADLAENILILLKNTQLFEALSKGARKESLKYDWGKTASSMFKIINNL